MSSATNNQAPPTPPPPKRLSAVLETPLGGVLATAPVDHVAIVRIGILAGLFVWLHWFLLDWLARSWYSNPNWSHGFLLPLFSLFLVYTRWGELRAIRARPFWPGLGLMLLFLAAEAVFLVAPGYRSFWLAALSAVGMLFSLVLFLGGWRMMRLLWLPILFLTLAMPLPESLYTRMAYPLQEFAAAGAVKILSWLGVQISREASSIELTSRSFQVYPLTVAEACSGMRLLMAFFALGVATAYLETRPVWQRVVLVAAALPIAVFCNLLRVAITCTMYFIDQPEMGKGVLHTFTGMLMLIPAFAMLYLVGWVLNRFLVEEAEGPADAPKGPPTRLEDRA